jgi:lipopolysaccharide/colanic/teichoic acid biosynthesis glycosyltransferase
MVVNAEKQKKKLLHKSHRDGPLFKVKNDPRVTRFGKFLRRFSLDELPNFFNVFKGDLSLIGPRPHLPDEVEKYKKWQKKILMMKPGVTGLAQISGRSDLSFDDEMRLDLFYLENWSFWLDIKIFWKTIWVVLSQKGAD